MNLMEKSKMIEQFLKEQFPKVAEALLPVWDIYPELKEQIFSSYQEFADQQKPKWISVEEQRPKVDEIVLVYVEGLGARQGFYDGKIWSSIGLMSGEFARKVTHWQPLPPLPEKPTT